jgi:hypothetical protein
MLFLASVITQSCCKLSFIHQIYNITNNLHTLTETQLHCYTPTKRTQGQGHIMTNSQSVSMSWCLAQSRTIDQSLLSP